MPKNAFRYSPLREESSRARSSSRNSSRNSIGKRFSLTDDSGRESYPIELDTTFQHTLVWESEMRGVPAGKCNLYTFPKCSTLEDEPLVEVDTDLILAMLKDLILAMVNAEGSEFWTEVDLVGAHAVHALLVANNDPVLELCLEIFRQQPKLILQVHSPKRLGLFVGENVLHIMIANSREEQLCTLLDIAVCALGSRLDEDDLYDVLVGQAVGPFFRDAPQSMYGGTPLGYAASFSQRKAIVKLLNLQLQNHDPLSLDGDDARCRLTGFLPLHAATCNGLRQMYDYIA